MTKGEQTALIIFAIAAVIIGIGLMISTTVGSIGIEQTHSQFAIACLQAGGTPLVDSHVTTCIAR